MNADKPIPVENFAPAMFMCGHKNLIRVCNIKGHWHPEILVAMIPTVGVPTEEALADIGMKYRKVVVNLEFDGKAYWMIALGYV